MQLRALVPNTLTCLNLACGCVGIALAFQEELAWAGIMIGVAAVFDFFDGFAARLLKVSGELGKQLDSLADCVTFGIRPAVIIYQLILISFGAYFEPFRDRDFAVNAIAMVAFLLAIFSVVRLAIFNIDTEQSDSFLGVPTPANAIFVGSLPVILDMQYQLNMYVPIRGALLDIHMKTFYLDPFDGWLIPLLFNPWFYVGFSIVMSALLVVRVPLFSLKFKSFKWAANKVRYSFLICVAVLGLLVALPYIAWQLSIEAEWIRSFPYLDYVIVPMIIVLYILISFLILPFSKRNTNEVPS